MIVRAIRNVVLLLAAFAGAGCDAPPPQTSGAPAHMRLITEAQYRNIIADVFGDDIAIAGRFDAPQRTDGLQQIGAGRGAITPSAFERYDQMARSIASQVVDVRHRHVLMPCKPADVNAADEPCARMFLESVGLHLFRRPLSGEELSSRVEIATSSATKLEDFYGGLSTALATLLVSPNFLYINDALVAESKREGAVQLTDYARASRLSFFLWNTGPDAALLAAAERGELSTGDGLARHVDRMLGSPRFRSGIRAFFSDMLGFDAFDRLGKDSVIYPAFSSAVIADAKEQTLRTIVDHVVDQDGDYRDIFVTRKTFMTGPLAILYRVPIDRPSAWTPYEFSGRDGRAGILSHLSFAALHSHPGKSSPTLRGRALREALLCQKIPDPPGDVNFDAFNDPNSPNRTARERLAAHNAQPTCAGCHRLTDPVGLALETYDGAGQHRTTENGATIDTSGELDGRAFSDMATLATAVRDNPAAVSCLTARAFAYAVQRSPAADERLWIDDLTKRFAGDQHRVPALFKRIALSDAFFAIQPAAVSLGQQSAAVTRDEEKSP